MRKLADPLAKPFPLLNQAQTPHPAGLYDSQQPVHVMFQLLFQILPVSLRAKSICIAYQAQSIVGFAGR